MIAAIAMSDATSFTATQTYSNDDNSTQMDGANERKKKRRLPRGLSPDSHERTGTNSKWLLNVASDSTGGVILNDNLGDTSKMVDSLTHQVNSWSLTAIPSQKNSKETKEKCKAAKRNVMRALRHQEQNDVGGK